MVGERRGKRRMKREERGVSRVMARGRAPGEVPQGGMEIPRSVEKREEKKRGSFWALRMGATLEDGSIPVRT